MIIWDEEVQISSVDFQCYVDSSEAHQCPFCDQDIWTAFEVRNEVTVWECNWCGATFSSFSFPYASEMRVEE